MTTERIVSTLHKAIQAVADVAAKTERRPSESANPVTAQSAQGTDGVSSDAPPGIGHRAGHEHVAQSAQTDALALGLPPPSTGPLPVTTLAVGVALQVIADRMLRVPDEPSDARTRSADQTVTTSAIDVQPTGEVREIQFVKGVPKATNVIATDDRPRQRLDAIAGERTQETKAASDHPQAEPPSGEHAATAASTATGVVPPEAALHPEPDQIVSMAILLQSGGSEMPQHVGILPSAILNAAMLPGWPPPRMLEGAQAQAIETADDVLARREAAIAALLEALGIEPGTVADTKGSRKSAWRWLRRISIVLAGIMTVVTTLASEIADMRDEENEIADGRTGGRRGGRPSKRIYLE